MGIDRARDDRKTGTVDHLVAVEAVADGRDEAAGDGDVGTAESPRTDVDQPVAENELRGHYAPTGAGITPEPGSAELATSTIASPGTFAASAGLLKASSCFAFAAERTSATSAM